MGRMHARRRRLSPLVLALCLPALSAARGAEPLSPAAIEAAWLREDEVRTVRAALPVTPEDDAAGGCDGAKTGGWGFHTLDEENPWWQVDLGAPVSLDRVVLWNRCDGGFAARASRLVILLSEDGATFREAYRHDGTTFGGQPDGKPLSAPLGGGAARFLRITLPYRSYFHLDEVEVFAPGADRNLALGRPATQSSASEWSVRHGGPAPAAALADVASVVRRGLRLAEDLEARGTDVAAARAALEEVGRAASALTRESGAASARDLWRTARWTVRRLALSNPLLDFDSILFVERVPPAFPHMSDQFYGWWSRPGGGIRILEGFRGDSPRLRLLTADWPPGSFLSPDLSWDGTKVLFAWCRHYPHLHDLRDKVDKENLPEDSFYHVFEMDLDGTDVRRLTRGKYDDFDARYLPDGKIAFLSTRKGQAVQVGAATGAATVGTSLPDSYVRCGGDNWRPVPVFTLHRMEADGGNLHPISAFENFEWTPNVASDGRILYARWDYIDRFNGSFISLWATNPDGTNAQLVYGNFTTVPQCIFEARPIPGSRKLVFTAGAHHSNLGGALALLDRGRGTEMELPVERLTPEIPFPETEGWPNSYYANPFPLSERHFLVAWSDRPLPPHTFVTDDRNPPNSLGIYLHDAFGNLEPLHRDPAISCMHPIPVRPRPRPPVLPDAVDPDGPPEGRFLLQDVYRGLSGVPRGTVASLRVIGVPPKVQPHMNSPVLGVSREDPGKFILGTVPVEADGSAYFRAPSGVPIFFQALDRDGLMVQTMRSLTYLQPGTTLSCVGCHESREEAPRPGAVPRATLREPSRLRPGPEGTWPLRYDRLVQPVLDRHCVRCHDSARGEEAATPDLTAARSYESLIAAGGGDLEKLAFEKDLSLVLDAPSRRSKVLASLRGGRGHEDLALDPESLLRIVTWMDVYAQRQGHFSPEQETELVALRRSLAPMLEDAGTGP